jgi:hypothetical protein
MIFLSGKGGCKPQGLDDTEVSAGLVLCLVATNASQTREHDGPTKNLDQNCMYLDLTGTRSLVLFSALDINMLYLTVK